MSGFGWSTAALGSIQQAVYEWLIVALVLVAEVVLCIVMWWNQARIKRDMRRTRTRMAEARSLASAEITPSRLDDILGNTLLTRAWTVLRSLSVFPAPDLGMVWSAAQGEVDGTVEQARSAPNQALLIGLLGTVGSLVLAFWSMDTTLRSGFEPTDPMRLAGDIAPYLRRFRAAFFSTGIGVAFAFLLSCRAAGWQRRIADYLSKAEEFILQVCAPKAIPPSVESSLQHIQESLEKSNQVAEMTAANMQRATVSIARQISLMQTATKEATDAYSSISGDVKLSAERLERNVAELKEVQKTVQDGYASVERGVREGYERLFARQEKATDTFLSTALRVQQLLTGTTNQTLEALNTAGGRFDRATEHFDEAAREFQEMSKVIGLEAYNKMEEWASRFSTMLVEQHAKAELIEQRLAETTAAVRDLMERLDPQLLHSDDWAKVRAALDNGAATGELYLETAERMTGELSEQNRHLADISQSLPQTAQAVTRAQQLLSRAMARFIEQIEKQTAMAQSAAQEQSAAATALATAHTELVRKHDEILARTRGDGDGAKPRRPRKPRTTLEPNSAPPEEVYEGAPGSVANSSPETATSVVERSADEGAT